MSKKVLIMNTGGTLASVVREHGITPGLTTESMERELHIVAGEAQLTMQEFMSLDSANIFPEDWARLAQAISRQRDCFDGIVVIHGTDKPPQRSRSGLWTNYPRGRRSRVKYKKEKRHEKTIYCYKSIEP